MSSEDDYITCDTNATMCDTNFNLYSPYSNVLCAYGKCCAREVCA